jgi:hypothetical protein
VSSYDGRLVLEFHPEGRHAERIVIDGLLGYMESHYAKW